MYRLIKGIDTLRVLSALKFSRAPLGASLKGSIRV